MKCPVYCIDSWAWIDYFQNTLSGRKSAQFIESEAVLFCTPITLFEVYHAILKKGTESTAKEHITRIRSYFKTVIEELDDELIFSAAKIKKEEGLALADALLLATARRHGAKVVTGDPDFKKFGETIFIG